MTEPSPDPSREADDIAARYARRSAGGRYEMIQPDVWQTLHERQRAWLRLFAQHGWRDLADKRLLEVGSGSGTNLLELQRLGFAPAHLTGIELLPERHAQARAALAAAVTLFEGDALRIGEAAVPSASQDAVLASTVFSSLLDDAFQERLAAAMWRWVRPGGAVLWYDFTVDNPRNPDVRGVPLARLRELFPHGRIESRRITLAPPIARAVTRVHPGLYTLFNAIRPLRTHVLAWIAKP